MRTETSRAYGDDGQILRAQQPRQPVLRKRSIEEELKRGIIVRRQSTINEQARRLIRDNFDQFGVEIMRRRRAGADEIGQPIISIADKCTIGRCVPILRSWVIGDDPAAAGIQALSHNTEAGAQIIRVQGPIAKDALEFRNEVSPIEFRHQSFDPPKRAAKYPRT